MCEMRKSLFRVVVIACFLQRTHAANQSMDQQQISKLKNIKYILIWRDQNLDITNKFGIGQSAFEKCLHSNCYATRDKKILQSVKDFHAVVFNGRNLDSVLPEERSVYQKYVYAIRESSHYFPICDDRYNNFFNLTWTFRLNSDLWLAHYKIFNLSGEEVGPKITMRWVKPGALNNETKEKLRSKNLAAAWFVSYCRSKSEREDFVNHLHKELEKFGHSVHIYGRCGRKCPKSDAKRCFKLIEKNYFFYLAFENSFDEDYVTEKVMNGYQNYAVPVVFGAANYSRFLPPGSYLNARHLGPRGLAIRMAYIITSYRRGQHEQYHSFFRSHSLSWLAQVNEVSGKMFAAVGSLIRLSNFLPITTEIAVAQSLPLPILDYAVVSCIDLTEEHLSKPETNQNACIHSIYGLRKYELRHKIKNIQKAGPAVIENS